MKTDPINMVPYALEKYAETSNFLRKIQICIWLFNFPPDDVLKSAARNDILIDPLLHCCLIGGWKEKYLHLCMLIAGIEAKE